jgi:hypothetical protein
MYANTVCKPTAAGGWHWPAIHHWCNLGSICRSPWSLDDTRPDRLVYLILLRRRCAPECPLHHGVGRGARILHLNVHILRWWCNNTPIHQPWTRYMNSIHTHKLDRRPGFVMKAAHAAVLKTTSPADMSGSQSMRGTRLVVLDLSIMINGYHGEHRCSCMNM